MLSLCEFDQESILHTIRTRFTSDKIYTQIGQPILISVNPYKMLPLYSKDQIAKYKTYFSALSMGKAVLQPPPHLYLIAEAAFQEMIKEKKNQSIIISGESGSGKTQSTKIILNYLSTASGKKNTISLENQIISSNPILEAFGNAKTVRNDNSSRFGKFIQISFRKTGEIVGGRIHNYLLEKSRVVSVHPNERNYHIFYQLIKGASEEQRKLFKIREVDYFTYINQSLEYCEGTDDEEEFKNTSIAMKIIGFKEEEANFIFRVVMGVLYLGNIVFEEADNNTCVVSNDSVDDFEAAAELLGLSSAKLIECLTHKQMMDPSNGNTILKVLDWETASKVRDAVAKSIYSRTFDWIIKRINSVITLKKTEESTLKIGILDIFGFENFEDNSFEQLCINYTNERLQQFFNNHIFKLEQQEYLSEIPNYQVVEYEDNKEIIEMIDAKMGLFNLMDSEGMLRGSDRNLLKSVKKNVKAKALKKANDSKFVVSHYAGDVAYSGEGMVAKNMDSLNKEAEEALNSSKNKLVKKIFEKKDKDKKKIPGRLMAESISKQFKKQLDELFLVLNKSNPRYVKCIKSNGEKEAELFWSKEVLFQLICSGVIDCIKIRKKGYEIRRSLKEFVLKYKEIWPDMKERVKEELMVDYRQVSLEIVDRLRKEMEKDLTGLLLVGTTKVFMKEEAKNALDACYAKFMGVIRLQAVGRGMKQRKVFSAWKLIQSRLSAIFRGIKVRTQVEKKINSIKKVRNLLKKADLKQKVKEVKNILRSLHIGQKRAEEEKIKAKRLFLSRRAG